MTYKPDRYTDISPYLIVDGAQRTIDYRSHDFTADGTTYDVIVDCVGNAPYRRVRHLLAPGGALLLESMHRDDVVASYAERDGWFVGPTVVEGVPDRHTLASAVVSYTLHPRAVELVTRLMESKGKNSNTMDRHNNRIGFFLHTPFPSFEVFRCHPRREELVVERAGRMDGLLLWLRMELAHQGVADLGEERDLRVDRLLLGLDDAKAAVAGLDHLVHRHDDDEVDGRGDEQEVDERREEHAELHLAEDQEVVEVGGAHEHGDQRHQHAVDEGLDDGTERGAHDDGDGKVDDVALHDEVLESLKHEA